MHPASSFCRHTVHHFRARETSLSTQSTCFAAPELTVRCAYLISSHEGTHRLTFHLCETCAQVGMPRVPQGARDSIRLPVTDRASVAFIFTVPLPGPTLSYDGAVQACRRYKHIGTLSANARFRGLVGCKRLSLSSLALAWKHCRRPRHFWFSSRRSQG